MRKGGDMANTSRRIPVRIGATLETIEEHLKEQDKESKRGAWLVFAGFGASISLMGASLWISKSTTDIVAYAFLILYGLALMVYALKRVSKIK
jgi:hypothetical protein